MLLPNEILPSPTLPRDIFHQLVPPLPISTKLHHRRSIHTRCFPAFQWRLPRIPRKIRPCVAHHIAELDLRCRRTSQIVCRKYDRYLRRVIDLLRWNWPSVVGKIGEALVGKSGVEQITIGGNVALRAVAEEDRWLLQVRMSNFYFELRLLTQ